MKRLPLMPVLAGLLLVPSVTRAQFASAVISYEHGTGYAAGFTTLLASGVLALIGAVMIVPLFVPSRWRRRAYDDDDISMPEAIGLTR